MQQTYVCSGELSGRHQFADGGMLWLCQAIKPGI
jgi:hypothetical protein